MAITQCPQDLVDDATLRIIRQTGEVERLRLLPVAGGTLDQTQSFDDARQMIEIEQARVSRGRTENT